MSSDNRVRSEYIFNRHEDTGAVDYEIPINQTLLFLGYKLHLSDVGGTSEDFSINAVSGEGTPFNVNYISADMETVSDDVNIFAEPIPIEKGDGLRIVYPNTNSRTFGLEVIFKQEI